MLGLPAKFQHLLKAAGRQICLMITNEFSWMTKIQNLSSFNRSLKDFRIRISRLNEFVINSKDNPLINIFLKSNNFFFDGISVKFINRSLRFEDRWNPSLVVIGG